MTSQPESAQPQPSSASTEAGADKARSRLGAQGKILVGLLLGLLLALYPFAVYMGLQRLNVRLLAGLLLLVFLLRFTLIRGKHNANLNALTPIAVGSSIICLLALVRGEGQYLLYYPVVVSLTFLGTFLYTLRVGPPMIERFAKLAKKELPPEAIPYCRKVTWVWCCFFLLNGLTSLAVIRWGSLKDWTFYNGFLSYVLIGLLFAVEFGVRCLVKRKYAKPES